MNPLKKADSQSPSRNFLTFFPQGATLEEAGANLFDALQLVLAYHRDEARRQEHLSQAVRHEFQLAQGEACRFEAPSEVAGMAP